jgi:hypothetical protein
MVDESLICMGGWLKIRMKLVIVVVEKRIELVKKITSTDFCIYDH